MNSYQSTPGNSRISIWDLDPVTVIDGEHLCPRCGDSLELGTTAIQGQAVGLLHEFCAEQDPHIGWAHTSIDDPTSIR